MTKKSTNKMAHKEEGMINQKRSGKTEVASSMHKKAHNAVDTHPKWALVNETEGLDDQAVESQWKKHFSGLKKGSK